MGGGEDGAVVEKSWDVDAIWRVRSVMDRRQRVLPEMANLVFDPATLARIVDQ